MEREIHPFTLHHFGQQADGLHHHHCVRGLDGDNHIGELLLHADAQEFHARLHHTLRRIAITRHDAVAQRAVVYTDADGGVVLLTDLQEGDEALANLFNLSGILLVRIFQMLEGTGCIHVVAGIDAHLFSVEGSHIGHTRIEVDIGYQGHHTALTAQRGIDVLQVLGLAHTLRGEAYILASGLDNAERLLHTGLGIHGDRIGHTLQTNRVIAPKQSSTHLNGMSLPTGIIEKIH